MDINKMNNKSVGYVGESVWNAYVEARCLNSNIEPEHFFDRWMEDEAPWCSDEFCQEVFSVFVKSLQLYSGGCR